MRGPDMSPSQKDTPTVSKPLNQNTMAEAARLVRAGRLAESAALLRRLLEGTVMNKSAADHDDRTRGAAGRASPIIDGEFEIVDESEGAPPAPHTPAALRGLDEHTPKTSPDIAPGGQFIEAVYSNAAGSRAYKLYIPGGYHGQPVPLIVMLHGCTQSPDDFAAGTRMNVIAETQTCLVAYPAQPSNANPAKCWNWFRSGDQRRGDGEPSLIAGITRQIMQEYCVDARRVYVGGLSAGGAAAAVMGATYPDLYAAIGVHSGLACGAASDLASALAAMKQGNVQTHPTLGKTSVVPKSGPSVPTIVFHGDRDTTVNPRNGDQVIAQSKGTTSVRSKVHRGRVAGGHAYTRTVHVDAAGRAILEHWKIHGAGHAWSGGSPAGSYTDPLGPDATKEMLRFFLENQLAERLVQ
jgi:poly(hydroxyalkanoate) depolymerase family esterase